MKGYINHDIKMNTMHRHVKVVTVNKLNLKIYRINYSPSSQVLHLQQSFHLVKNRRTKVPDRFANLVLHIKINIESINYVFLNCHLNFITEVTVAMCNSWDPNKYLVKYTIYSIWNDRIVMPKMSRIEIYLNGVEKNIFPALLFEG
jgi:hypothetical protein